MKKILIVIVWICYALPIYGQVNFSTISYGTDAYRPQELFLGDSLEIYQVGQCTVRGTTNGQITWQGYCYTPLYLFGGAAPARANCFVVGAKGVIRKNEACQLFGNWKDQVSNTLDTLFSIKFYNKDTGFIAGENGKILRTFNNGQTWTTLPTGVTQTLRKLIITPNGNLFAAGYAGTIIKSADTANSWTTLNTGVSTHLTDLIQVNNNTLYACGSNGVLIKSTDAGATWQSITTGIATPIHSVYFLDSLTGFIGSDNGILKRTHDGGITWSAFPLPSYNNPVLDIIFKDTLNGFFISEFDFYKTIDGGITWSKISQELNAVCYLSKDTIVAVGDDVFRKSFDGGYTWNESHPFNRINMYDVDFIDADTGYASGYFGAIFKTHNGGNTWAKQTTNSNAFFRSMHFFNANKGITVGSNYSIGRTNNGGITWQIDSSTNSNLYGYYDVFFLNDSLGYICGSQGKIARTTNGGASFTTLTTGVTKYLLKIIFLNQAKGFAIGESGTLLRTLDSGATWVKINLGTSLYLPSIAFADSLNGYIGTEYGDFYVTTDGGITWKGKIFNAGAINDITFYDAYTGYAVGEHDYKAIYDPLKALNGYNEFCKGGGFSINTLVPNNVTIDSGNIFLIEIDTLGNNFNNAVVVGSAASDTSGKNVSFNIPNTFNAGYYQARLRAKKTAPIQTSITSTIRLFDNPTPLIYISNDTLFTAFNEAYNYQWRYNLVNIPNENKNYLVITQPGQYAIVVKYRCCNDGYYSIDVSSCNNGYIINPIVTPHIYICDSSATTLVATGAANYRWYKTDTSTIILSTDSFFITPLLIASDTFYVAAYNGICESNRARIIVSKTSKPQAPVTSNYFQCNNNELFIIPTNGFGFNWYTDTTQAPFKTNSTFLHLPQPVTDTIYVAAFNYQCMSYYAPIIITVGSETPQVAITGDTTIYPFETTTYAFTNTANNNIQWIVNGGTYTAYTDSIVVAWGNSGNAYIAFVETDTYGCKTDTVFFNVDISVIHSINNQQVADIRLYPNPVNDRLNIELKHKPNKAVSLTCYNSIGQKIFERKLFQKTESIYTKHWPKGLYHIYIHPYHYHQTIIK